MTTRRPPDDRKETQTAVVWSCFPFIRSGQNHLARHSERGKKTSQTEEEVGRQHQGKDRPDFGKSQRAVENREKMEKTGCKIICGAPTTLAVKGLMMMMMTVSMGGRTITNLRFADDIDGLAGEELANSVERLNKASTAYGMEISAKKTKLMTTPVASTQRSK